MGDEGSSFHGPKRPLRGRWKRECHRVRWSFRLLVQLSISSVIPQAAYDPLSGRGVAVESPLVVIVPSSVSSTCLFEAFYYHKSFSLVIAKAKPTTVLHASPSPSPPPFNFAPLLIPPIDTTAASTSHILFATTPRLFKVISVCQSAGPSYRRMGAPAKGPSS